MLKCDFKICPVKIVLSKKVAILATFLFPIGSFHDNVLYFDQPKIIFLTEKLPIGKSKLMLPMGVFLGTLQFGWTKVKNRYLI